GRPVGLPAGTALPGVAPALPPAPGSARSVVAVDGDGLLASAVRATLARDHRVVAPRDPECEVVVSADDGWATAAEPPRPDVRWLPLRVELGVLVVGPTTVPGRTGCVACARTRRHRALGAGSPRAALLRAHGERLAARPSPVLTPWACRAAAELVAAEVAAPTAGVTDRAVVFLSLTTMAVDRHLFLPVPDCPRCGGLPADRPPVLMDVPRPKPDRDVLRVRDLRAGWDGLVSRYVDGRTGLIRQLDVRTDYPYPMVSAPVRLPGLEEEAGFGRDLDFGSCARTALAEALERWGGARPGGHRTTVRCGWAGVADRALYPPDLGLYPPERYAEADFPYPPFRPDIPLNWVWGHSFARSAPVLVPEDYAYYRTRHGGATATPLAYEVSNGCALGGCLEEAALHGLIELAERDAFLLTWYGRVPVPRVDLSTVADPRIGVLVERIRQESGHRVLAFATTAEHGIASVWVMAVRPPGRRWLGEPAAVCAAGAHVNPGQALLNGLLELAANMGWNRPAFREEAGRAAAMVDDPELVREMRDHALLYCHPAAFDRFSFLLEGDGDPDGGGVPVAEAFAAADCRPRGTDIRADLAEVVARFTDRGMDVIVVDQTTDEHRAGGLACAKVIVPGLLPMTFGHRTRRTHGLPRLARPPVAVRAGARAPGGAALNPHPHPFP
ncbi:TOMM precursor leader peptide-binding protein, partial [Streptomyces sp. NPDC002785]|uniref:TOMM precursor leader peptide-binding protein n=1 Tax=Streptomyces sp. NPDC002785 TaxID=3154543 RepID=UPI00332DFB97